MTGRTGRYLVVVPFFGLLAFLVVYPLLMLVYGSMATGSPRAFRWGAAGVSFSHFAELYTSPAVWRATGNTVLVTAGGVLVAVAVALAFAWLVARTNVPAKGVLEAAATMPLYVSPLVAAMAWSALGSPKAGLLNLVLAALDIKWRINIYSIGGLVFVLGVYYAPYAYMFLVSALQRMDPTLEEAAAICGATPVETARRVTLPLILHAIASSVLLVAVVMLAVYAIPSILAEPANLPFLTTYLYKLIVASPPRWDKAAALSVLLIGITSIGIYLQWRLLQGRRFTTVAGKGFRPRTVDLGGWRWVGLAAAVLYLAVTVGLPFFALAQVSLRPFMFIPTLAALFDWQQFTMANYRALLQFPQVARAVWNTAILGVVTAVFGTFMCFTLAYVIHRTRLPGRRLLDYLSTLPIAVPGLVIGVAYLWAWISLPIGLYGTIWILAAGYIARFLPDGVRAASSTLVQIHEELEESAWVCGAPVWSTIGRIVAPLARPGIGAAAILLFLLSVRELGSSIFLYTSGNVVVSVQLLQLWESGQWGTTAALALLQSLVLMLAAWVMRYFSGWQGTQES